MSSDKHQEQEEKTTQATEKQRTPDTENVQPDDEITEKVRKSRVIWIDFWMKSTKF